MVVCGHVYPQRLEEGVRSCGAVLSVCWNLNTDSLQEQHAFLATKLSVSAVHTYNFWSVPPKYWDYRYVPLCGALVLWCWDGAQGLVHVEQRLPIELYSPPLKHSS